MVLSRLAVAAVLLIVALGSGAFAYAADDAQKSTPTTPPAAANPAPATPAAVMETETGLATVYSDRLNGHKTASGARYDRNRLTAAHKTLPFGTKIKVTNIKNLKSVIVTINDRGPMQVGRILDLSTRAAQTLGIRATAMAEVTAEVVGAAPERTKK